MKFNIDDFSGKYCMHCATEEEAKSFCAYLHSIGRTWRDGQSYAEYTYYKTHREETVYFFNDREFCDRRWARNHGYTILEWSDFIYDDSDDICITTLSEVSRKFEIGDYKFYKIKEIGDAALVIITEPVFESTFGSTDDFGKSDILPRLISDVLPRVEELVGAENVLEFDTDLQAYGERNKYLDIRSKISIPTYVLNCDYSFKSEISSWYWLSTSYNNRPLCSKGSFGVEAVDLNNVYGVCPTLLLKSSIEVKTKNKKLRYMANDSAYFANGNYYMKPYTFTISQ